MGIGKNIHKVFESRPNLLKTLWINFKVLSFKDAIKFPIVLYGRVELRGLKRGSIVFDKVAPAALRIGGAVGSMDECHEVIPCITIWANTLSMAGVIF